MSGQHTPGPWRIRDNARHSQDECDLTICGDIFCLADINGPNYAHCEPNAGLMAASPDLLEALQEARLQLEYLEDRWPTGTTPAVLARVKLAILKATGEA